MQQKISLILPSSRLFEIALSNPRLHIRQRGRSFGRKSPRPAAPAAVMETWTSATEGKKTEKKKEEKKELAWKHLAHGAGVSLGLLIVSSPRLIRAWPIARLSKYERRNPRGDVRA